MSSSFCYLACNNVMAYKPTFDIFLTFDFVMFAQLLALSH
jgi:hypothetical protein